jgi:polynucleotide 5'-hydroxyl-kinase GRC3/NOL9
MPQKIVELGKTLIVDGPASVTMISGNAEVFGSTISSGKKIVIRENKRLPFAVKEKTVVDISLGQGASAEEVDGDTIPSSWISASQEFLSLNAEIVVAMVVGSVDSGKTSFCTYLVNRMLHEKKKVAVLDGDLGQSDIGPPCTLAYTFVTRPITDLFDLHAKSVFFIGITSPAAETRRVTEGLVSLKQEILKRCPDVVLVNTDGWVNEQNAVGYKLELAEQVNPAIIFCVRQKDELEPLINALTKFKTVVVDSPMNIKQRSMEKRRTLRELGYMKYLRNAKVQSLPLNWLKIEGDEFLGLSGGTHENTRQARRIYDLLGMKPLHLAEFKDRISVIIGRRRWIDEGNIKKLEESTKKKVLVTRKGDEEGLLVALHGVDRRFVGIGVLQEIDYVRNNMKVLTPVQGEISMVSFGKVKLDKNLKEVTFFAEENQSELSGFSKLF